MIYYVKDLKKMMLVPNYVSKCLGCRYFENEWESIGCWRKENEFHSGECLYYERK